MYVCVCVLVYVLVCVCTSIYVSVCLSVSVSVSMSLSVSLSVSVCLSVFMSLSLSLFLSLSSLLFSSTSLFFTFCHTHVYARTHVHTHIRSQPSYTAAKEQMRMQLLIWYFFLFHRIDFKALDNILMYSIAVCTLLNQALASEDFDLRHSLAISFLFRVNCDQSTSAFLLSCCFAGSSIPCSASH